MSLNAFELQIYLVLKLWELAYFTIAKESAYYPRVYADLILHSIAQLRIYLIT